MKSLRLLKCVKNKNIFVRCDFNVPLNNSKISDASKIIKTLPTIEYLLNMNPKKIILATHFGRPNGFFNNKMTLEPIAKYLKQVFGELYYGCDGAQVNDRRIILLENLRFNSGEESNCSEFSNELAKSVDIYVNDAFAVSHRKHSSVNGILNYINSKYIYKGFLYEQEKQILDNLINDNKKPFVVILGGSKISDKIKLIENLLIHADYILIGGGLSYCFLKAMNYNIGESHAYYTDVQLAKNILEKDIHNKIILRCDHIIANTDGILFQTSSPNIPNNFQGYDIGVKTIELFSNYLIDAKKVFWNGPLGMYENDKFKKGSIEILKILDNNKNSDIIIGGGETADFVGKNMDINSSINILTGGGASLYYLSKY